MRFLTLKQKDPPPAPALLPRLYELLEKNPEATHLVLTRAEYEEYKMVVVLGERPVMFQGIPILLEP